MAKKKDKARQILILPGGESREITGETGKYWLCGETRFRKSHGWPVIEEKEEEPAEEDAEA